MTESTLDRLDRDPGGARRYVAHLFVVGGASRERVRQKLRDKYGVEVTTRIITTWRNNDPELIALMEELEAIKRDASPGDDDAQLPPEVNRAQAVADLFTLTIQFPAFALLMQREYEREKSAPTTTAWGAPMSPSPADDDDPAPREDMAALLGSEGMSDEEFEADCIRRLGDYEAEHTPKPGAGSLS